MTVQELMIRFSEVPDDLAQEPLLTQFSEAMDSLLQQAQKPSACSTEHSAQNHYYLKLIGPLSIYRYGLSPREKVLTQLQDLLNKQKENPDGFAESLLPMGTTDQEVKGPGCS